MNIPQPLRVTIQTHGARPHQSGKGPDSRGSSGLRICYESERYPHGPVIEHVRDGIPMTAKGRALLGIK